MDKKQKQIIGVVFSVVALLVYLYTEYGNRIQSDVPEEGYQFCFWNVENYFDDHFDDYNREPDKTYDRWFSSDSSALDLKLQHLGDVLLDMNAGKGPDILALCEVESTPRAPELLMQSLNARLEDPALHYKHIVMKEVKVGRYISCAVLTRLPLSTKKPDKLDSRMRITEARLDVNGHELVVHVGHWTSRVTDETGDRRLKYAQTSYGRFHALHKNNPSVDYLICGDFNDNPDERSVLQGLNATDDLEAAPANNARPYLYNLLAKPYHEGIGSHYYGRKAFMFDQILVSSGLLHGPSGWTCNPTTARVMKDLMADKRGRPFRFGNEKDKGNRGYSDHFPVTVRLKVND